MTSFGTISVAAWDVIMSRFWGKALGISTVVCLGGVAEARRQWQRGQQLLIEAPLDQRATVSAHMAIQKLASTAEMPPTVDLYQTCLATLNVLDLTNACPTVATAVGRLQRNLTSDLPIIPKTKDEERERMKDIRNAVNDLPTPFKLSLLKDDVASCLRELRRFETDRKTLLSKDLTTVNIPYKPIAVGILGFVGMVYSALKYFKA